MLVKQHTMTDYGIYDYALPAISGPDATVWEFIVDSIQGKDIPPFMNFNDQANKLEFRPDSDTYSGNTYYWLLTVREDDSQTFLR